MWTPFNFVDETFFGQIFNVMRDIRSQKQLCDVAITVANKTFHAHRIVLASAIPYFRLMFTCNMVESQHYNINMKEIDSRAVESLIDFAYSGQICIDEENVTHLLIASSLMMMYNVQDACTDFLITKADPNNILEIRKLAYSYSCTRLAREADRYIQQYFPKILETQEFLSQSLDELIELVSSDSTIFDNEDVFEICLRWINFNREARVSLLPKIFEFVPFESKKYLRDHVIGASCECQYLLDETKSLSVDLKKRRLQRNCFESISGEIFVIGGEKIDIESVNTVEIYNSETNTWRKGESMPTMRSFAGVNALKEKIYVFGGRNGNKHFSTVEIFDSKTNKWIQSREMSSEKCNPATTVLNNCIYIFGGFDAAQYRKPVECYYPLFNEWKKVVPPKERRFSGNIAALDGYIYALGGYDGNSILDSVERYDPIENKWNKVSPMINKRVRFGVAALNGKLYVCGGCDEVSHLRSVEEYDPRENKWKSLSPMKFKRAGIALVVNNNKLFAIGGRDYQSVLSSVEVYDPSTNEWSDIAPMRVPRHGVGAVVLPYL